ncbi:MAG TPA: hypothetical protein VFG09_12715 [Thermodesulfovibrionales bacterium]|nr:hypothetical protein [Thermodesulfovibrionales bacterium]
MMKLRKKSKLLIAVLMMTSLCGALTVEGALHGSANGACTATLSPDLNLHLPAVIFNGQDYWVDLTYVRGAANFLLSQAGGVTDAGQFSDCFPADLSLELKLHVPEILFNGLSYFADFQYISDSVFALTNAGENALYDLLPGATFQEGCTGPCLCPVMLAADMSGTFRLVRLSPDGSFSRYLMCEISWAARNSFAGVTSLITGQGIYRFQSEPADGMQQLTLDLSIDGNAPQHFDSGLVPATSQFPAISLSLDEGSKCFNIWLVINAAPR